MGSRFSLPNCLEEPRILVTVGFRADLDHQALENGLTVPAAIGKMKLQ